MNTKRVLGIAVAMLITAAVVAVFVRSQSDNYESGPLANRDSAIPEESLAVGQFRIDRWKHFYSHGDAFVNRGDFYWDSKLVYAGKVIDFCTPRGWSGSSLCDQRKYRGHFSLRTPSVVSESPPAVLVPFGGTSGNSDGEMWLFVDADGSLKKTRIATDSNHGVTDLDGEHLDFSDAWDLRKHEYLVLNNETWLHTSTLRVIELASPVGTLHLSFVSFSPDGRLAARIGFISTSVDERFPALIVNDMENPSTAKVYLMNRAPAYNGARSPKELSVQAKGDTSWIKGDTGFSLGAKKRDLKLVPANILLQVPVLSQTNLSDDIPDREYFFIGKSAPDLAVAHQEIREYFRLPPSRGDVVGDTAKLNLADWGSFTLHFSNQKIYLTDQKDNWGTRHVAAYIQSKILNKR